MTKFSFLVYHKNYSQFLDDIREVGVLHVVEKQKYVSDSTLEKIGEIKKVEETIMFLASRNVSDAVVSDGVMEGREALDDVLKLRQELENKRQQLTTLAKEINYAANWGDFSPITISKLKENGVQVRFFAVSTRRFDPEWVNKYPLEVVGQSAGLYYLVLIIPEGEEFELNLEELRQPERPISELEFYRKKLREEVEQLNLAIDKHAKFSLEAIEAYLRKAKEDLQYEKALENTEKEADEKVMLLEGWVPDDRKAKLYPVLEEGHVLFLEDKPDPEDQVPILLKNKPFAKIHETIGRFYDLPNHRELDLVPFFAPFYTMFFGFCLGDAGYGLLIVILATILKRKKPSIKNVLTLAQVLGLSTIVFGLLTGTIFGISLLEAEIPWLESAKAFMIDHNQLFYLAIILGIVQILFGMVLKVINTARTQGFWYSLSTIGWLILIIGLGASFGLGKMDVISSQLSGLVNTSVMVISGILILLLNHPKRNIFKNFGLGLWEVYGMATGLLGDLLSYLRLFALGVSSAILGMVFNSMAMSMKPDSIIFGPLVMIIILVFGHGITIFMSALGAFVHPIRLTFVEFYKNAGFTGGGKDYKPFEKLVSKNINN